MLFARWRHHIHFASGSLMPSNAMVTKISKWSRIQDSCRITPKIESLVVCAIPDISSKLQKDPFITFWVILLTHRRTDRQTNRQKHNLFGRGNQIVITVYYVSSSAGWSHCWLLPGVPHAACVCAVPFVFPCTHVARWRPPADDGCAHWSHCAHSLVWLENC